MLTGASVGCTLPLALVYGAQAVEATIRAGIILLVKERVEVA